MEGFLIVSSSFLYVSYNVYILSYLNAVLHRLHVREVTYLRTVNVSLNMGFI